LSSGGAAMEAELDTVLVAVFCTADDLLPERPGNAHRWVTDAEVVTRCVAQAIMGVPFDRRGDLFRSPVGFVRRPLFGW
jgi:hypothetical protein